MPDPGTAPGALVDDFIAKTEAAGAQPMVTIPLIGWVGKSGPDRGKLASYSVEKYGPQQKTDEPWTPDAGNGVKSDGALIKGNDPNDANTPVDAAFMTRWVEHLVNRWGGAGRGGVNYYLLDNEIGLWYDTHRDVRPTNPTGAQMRDLMIEYAAAIRKADPNAQIVGPEEWGWMGMLHSPIEVQRVNETKDYGNYIESASRGGQDFMPWLLSELHRHDQQSGTRTLDYFTVHYYPQGGVDSATDVSPKMLLQRDRSTRSLWDPNYVDESWINAKIALIPRLQQWRDQNYPGLKIGITEYDFGAAGDISGALAQADALGIFGRENLDLATRWGTLTLDSPVAHAFQLYRNYDGQNSTFGDQSLTVTGAQPDQVAAFAARRGSDGALTVMVLNKQTQSAPIALQIAGAPAGATSAQHFELDSRNKIEREADEKLKSSILSVTLPPQSAHLFVIKTR